MSRRCHSPRKADYQLSSSVTRRQRPVQGKTGSLRKQLYYNGDSDNEPPLVYEPVMLRVVGIMPQFTGLSQLARLELAGPGKAVDQQGGGLQSKMN